MLNASFCLTILPAPQRWCCCRSWNVTISFSYYVPLIVFLINRAFEPSIRISISRNNSGLAYHSVASPRFISIFIYLFILWEKRKTPTYRRFFFFLFFIIEWGMSCVRENCTSNDFFSFNICDFSIPCLCVQYNGIFAINRLKPPTQILQMLLRISERSHQQTHCRWTVSWTNSHQSFTNIYCKAAAAAKIEFN